jgi:hypothetical protein
MRAKEWQIVMGLCLMVSLAAKGEASKWKALREGLEAVTKGSGKMLQEGAEAGAKRAVARKALLEGLESGAGTAGSRIGRTVAREAGKDAGALAARFGTQVTAPVIAKFGDDGARALASLSPSGAQRLASMADDLAASGRSKDWMKLVAERGDEVMEWLWKRKGSVAVGTVAAAVALQPEEFLRASEHVATSAVDSAGKHVFEPLIAQGAKHIAGPMAERAAAAIPWDTITLMALAGLIPWWIFRGRLTKQILVDGLRRILP